LGTINLGRTRLSAGAIQQLRQALPGRTITEPAQAPRDPNNPANFGAEP
jgi:hypothetical protein